MHWASNRKTLHPDYLENYTHRMNLKLDLQTPAILLNLLIFVVATLLTKEPTPDLANSYNPPESPDFCGGNPAHQGTHSLRDIYTRASHPLEDFLTRQWS